MLPQLDVDDLSPEALRNLAKFLTELSNGLNARADRLDQARDQKMGFAERKREASERFYSTGNMVLSYIANGTPINAAVDLIAAATGYDDEQVRFAYSLALRKRREERDIVIAWLKKKRWTDAQIAQVVDMHEKSVTRLRGQNSS